MIAFASIGEERVIRWEVITLLAMMKVCMNLQAHGLLSLLSKDHVHDESMYESSST